MKVFDSSAVLAAIFAEPGAQMVANLWSEGSNLLSAVNYSEVIAKLNERGMSESDILTVMEGVALEVVPFDQSAAHATGLLRQHTKALGLSLGDRACLSLAKARRAKVVTAEHIWKKLKGFDLILIR